MFGPDEIEARVRQQPFVPFRIVTSSGESYDVVDPKLVMIGMREMTVGTPHKRNPRLFSTLHFVAYNDIAEVHVLSVPTV
jgi:hypothetical protein